MSRARRRGVGHGLAHALPCVARSWLVMCVVLGCGTEHRAREGDGASLGGTSASLPSCGGPEQACCVDTGAACGRGLACGDAGTCHDDTAPISLACRTDADCAPDRRCCEAGRYGICRALAPDESCPLPDLALLSAGGGLTLEAVMFDGGTPSPGGCVRERGLRQRLRARVAVANVGAADFILGARGSRPTGSESAHDDFLRYTLLDASGSIVAESHGPLPCSDDASSAGLTCEFAGIAAGSIMPALGLECEALDVTGLPAGPYRVRVELSRQWPDADPSNQRLLLPVELPSFEPLQACPVIENPLLGLGIVRECGWSRATLPGPGTCVPGELIALDCGSCVNRPMLRLCPGDESCSSQTALTLGGGFYTDVSGRLQDPCTAITGTCPALGRYNVMLASEDPTQEASCTLVVSPSLSF